MNDEQFTNALKIELEELKNKYNYQDDVAFVHWCANQIYGIDNDLCESACEVGGSNDKGIDALWSEEDKKRVVIMQGKYSNVNRSIGREEISNLKAIPSLLLDVDFISEQKNSELKEKAADYRDAKKNNYNTELVLCVLGKITPGALEEIEQFNKEMENEGILVSSYDFKKLKDIYIENLTKEDEITGSETIKLVPGQYFEKNDTLNKAVIGTIKAKELTRIARKYKYALFQKNIRSFLSERDKYNKKILETLRSDQKNNFWHFNNGISIICKDFNLDKKTDSILLDNIQIVNGCQTTSTLLSADRLYNLVDDKVHVLVRIIKSDEESFTEKITETTNSQAEIKSRDFRSNDKIQKQLQNQISKLGDYIYIRKRGKEKTLSNSQKRNNKIIGMEIAAQALLAFILEKPSEAKSEKKMMFTPKSEGGYYEDIFSNDRTASETILSYELFMEQICLERKNWRTEKSKLKETLLKKQGRGESIEEVLKCIEENEYKLHADFHILALMHYLLIKKYGELNEKVIKDIRRSKEYSSISQKLYAKASTFIKSFIGDIRDTEIDFSHTKFFKSRQNYARIKDYVNRRIEEIQTMTGASIFEDIPFPKEK